MDSNLQKIAFSIASLSVFKTVKEEDVLKSFLKFIQCKDKTIKKIKLYSEFVHNLCEYGGDFGIWLKNAVLEDENSYIRMYASGKKIPNIYERNLEKELEIFTDLSKITYDDCQSYIGYEGYLPEFCTTPIDFAKEYKEHLLNVHKKGYGIFAKYSMFIASDEGELVPLKTADLITVDDLIGYERERQKVLNNTKALVEGKPAANVLLCGDAGTGKSSTVKAVANYYKNYGVRLIEIRKEQLLLLPTIMNRIEGNPLKFIIFIDDLSFNKAEKGFGTLKAILEGSAAAKAQNSVIYVTSNRRHLVKETFSDRDGDDIHRNDTIQELISLSERFGLTVYYSKPSKDDYLNIVNILAKRCNLDFEEEKLNVQAEAFALGKGGRSARVAKQFIDSILSSE